MWIIVFENIGHKYDFEVGWGEVDPVWVWGWSSSKETNLSYQINSAVPCSLLQDVIKSKLQLI